MKQTIFSKSKTPIKAAMSAIIFIAIQAINTPATVIIASIPGVFISGVAIAQTARNFPDSTVRGKIAFKAPPMIEVDGKAERLTPGARIRDERNILMMSGTLEGKSFTVNFKREPSTGQVHEIWMLSEEEAKVKLAGEKK